MGHMKNLLITIHRGGDEAVEAAKRLAPEWIPVSERLPDVDELVIVCVGGVHVTPLRRHKQDGFWQHEDGDIDEIIVTHWMPLPEPPEAK